MTMVEFKRPDGGATRGYYNAPEISHGGVVVLQEWWGLNDQIKGVVDRFASNGFTAIAPDLYEGRVTQEPDEANHMMTGLDWVGATQQDVAGAVNYLKESCDKVAVMGFCMGGALSVIAGVHLPNCEAVVCYYGIPPEEQADPAKMAVPFLGHFATRDDWCTPAAAAALESSIQSSEVVHKIHQYEADHGFFNETADAYDAAASALSWTRTIEFLSKNLK